MSPPVCRASRCSRRKGLKSKPLRLRLRSVWIERLYVYREAGCATRRRSRWTPPRGIQWNDYLPLPAKTRRVRQVIPTAGVRRFSRWIWLPSLIFCFFLLIFTNPPLDFIFTAVSRISAISTLGRQKNTHRREQGCSYIQAISTIIFRLISLG